MYHGRNYWKIVHFQVDFLGRLGDVLFTFLSFL